MPQLPSRVSRSAYRDLPADPADAGALDLFAAMARTGLHLDALQRECLGQHRLAFTEYSVLRILQRAPEQQLPPSVLADRILCTTGAMTKLVDRLQRAELVERAPDPVDRRGVLVRLTEAGGRLADAAAESYEAGRQRILHQLGEDDAAKIHTSLLRLLGVLERDRRES